MILTPLLLRRRPARVIAGAGLLSRTLGMGRNARTVLYVARGAAQFTGAWFVEPRLLDDSVEATVAMGFVNGLEPVSPDGKRLSEGGLVSGPIEKGEEGWILLKVQIDKETGKMTAKTQEEVSAENLTVLLSDSPRGDAQSGDEYGYAPLAYIKNKDGVLFPFQIAYFSYRHSTAQNRFGGAWRHFFHAA